MTVNAEVPIDPKTPLNVVLTVDQINQILNALRHRPLGEVIDVFHSLQSQGNMALAALKASVNGSGEQQPPPDPPITDPTTTH